MPGCTYDYDCPYEFDFEAEDETNCLDCDYYGEDDEDEE